MLRLASTNPAHDPARHPTKLPLDADDADDDEFDDARSDLFDERGDAAGPAADAPAPGWFRPRRWLARLAALPRDDDGDAAGDDVGV